MLFYSLYMKKYFFKIVNAIRLDQNMVENVKVILTQNTILWLADVCVKLMWKVLDVIPV